MLDLRRRQFISLLGSAAAWPLAARAQQPAPALFRRAGEFVDKTVVRRSSAVT